MGLLGLLEETDYKEDQGYLDLLEKMALQVCQDKRDRKVTMGRMVYVDQRVNVGQWAPLALQDLRDPVVLQDKEDQWDLQGHPGPQDSRDPNSLLRIWRDQERVTC